MDKVRFGRALGKGARGAAKSLWEAAEAVSAPDPSPQAARPVGESLQQAAAQVMEAHRVVEQSKRQVRGAAVEAGKGMFAPVRKLSGVLWLEVTGTFFAVITLFLLQGMWKLRGSLHDGWGSPAGHKLLAYAVVCALFAYFTVSSFVRASRRGKR